MLWIGPAVCADAGRAIEPPVADAAIAAVPASSSRRETAVATSQSPISVPVICGPPQAGRRRKLSVTVRLQCGKDYAAEVPVKTETAASPFVEAPIFVVPFSVMSGACPPSAGPAASARAVKWSAVARTASRSIAR